MNNDWKKIKNSKLIEKYNNIFKAPSTAENIEWQASKSNSVAKLKFIYNNQEYMAKAVKNSDVQNTAWNQENKWISSKHITLKNWTKAKIECTLLSSIEDHDGTITSTALWYDPYNRINYSLIAKHDKSYVPDIQSIVEDMSNYGPRKISNRMNIIFISGGILYLLAFYFLFIRLFKEPSLSAFYIFFFGIVMSIAGWLRFSSVKDKNEQLKSLPFQLDFDKEVESYKKIGIVCKKYKHGGEYFYDYESWESYISRNYKKYTMAQHRSNFSFFLKSEYRSVRDYIDDIKTLIFPGMVGLIPTLNDNILFGFTTFIFLVLYAIIETTLYERRRDFIIDSAKILLPNEILE